MEAEVCGELTMQPWGAAPSTQCSANTSAPGNAEGPSGRSECETTVGTHGCPSQRPLRAGSPRLGALPGDKHKTPTGQGPK